MVSRCQTESTANFRVRAVFLCQAWLSFTLSMMLWGLVAQDGQAQMPGVHYRHTQATPPGAIGQWQLQRGGPYPGYFQPIEIRGPEGIEVAFSADGQFEPLQSTPAKRGLLIGRVYRLRVTNIPLQEGREVFPTIELIDRTFPPPGQAWKFPIPIHLTEEDLKLALQGRFITRVIYIENPDQAIPTAETPEEQRWFDVGPNENPLKVADFLGRPIAIVRIGNRIPVDAAQPNPEFFQGEGPSYRPAPPVPAAQSQLPTPDQQRSGVVRLPRTPEALYR